jgi:hypothetical protein
VALHQARAVADHEHTGGLLGERGIERGAGRGERAAASRYKRYKIADKRVTQNTDRDVDGKLFAR